jgi:nitrogen fixation NifU-like protein
MALVGDPRCGDHIRLCLAIAEDKITDIRYKVFGCAAAIATTSILSELATGMSLDDALAITDDDVIEAAGGIPARKAHCSLLGVVGLHTALADYFLKKEKGKE